MTVENASKSNFIRTIVSEDLSSGKNEGRLATRFPPEPNGFLHIGHAKSICLNFGIAAEFPGGACNLRFDDTNPSKEEQKYVDSIREDVRWLGFDWNEREYFASDYFEQMYQCAVSLIKSGDAYVCSLSADEIREHRGTLTTPGSDSPFRNRGVEENLKLFYEMKEGKFEDGAHVLRAKIDMSSPNLNMRDPAMYRIKKESHHRTNDSWCIYPMYDFAHCLSDAFEGITHSLCTLEFEDHRPLYDWFLEKLDFSKPPRQIEFARLNLSSTVLSKRKLLELVDGGYVAGWDDPRMPTISGLRRKGYTPEALRDFCDRIGLSKANSIVDISLLEFCLREDLNRRANRVMTVLRPIKLVIENYPEDQVEHLEAENNPEDKSAGTRKLPFSRVLYIEQDDFMESPPKKFFRLSPGKEVRLKHAYYITCTGVSRDKDSGEICEIRCQYDPETRGGWSNDGRKVKGTLHWVSAAHGIPAKVNLYESLFEIENPNSVPEGSDYKDFLNANSLETLTECIVEPSLQEAKTGEAYQFLRLGYFCLDNNGSSTKDLVFNRSVGLRDSWAKKQQN